MRSGYEYYRQMGVEDGWLRDEQARAMEWLLAFDEATPPKGKIRMRLTGTTAAALRRRAAVAVPRRVQLALHFAPFVSWTQKLRPQSYPLQQKSIRILPSGRVVIV